jgi:hypothetical protein
VNIIDWGNATSATNHNQVHFQQEFKVSCMLVQGGTHKSTINSSYKPKVMQMKMTCSRSMTQLHIQFDMYDNKIYEINK